MKATKRTLNPRFACWLLSAVALLGAGVHALHEFQGKRLAPVWLQEARRAEQEGQTRQCANHLARYLAYQPADFDVLADYGLLLEKTATSPRARGQAVGLLQS